MTVRYDITGTGTCKLAIDPAQLLGLVAALYWDVVRMSVLAEVVRDTIEDRALPLEVLDLSHLDQTTESPERRKNAGPVSQFGTTVGNT